VAALQGALVSRHWAVGLAIDFAKTCAVVIILAAFAAWIVGVL
jgi:hypothetical protein